jgi:hypothetical protein
MNDLDLYEALEVCLKDMEQGADLDTLLFRYPELADELRPILEGSLNARSIAVPEPAAEVVRRNRARVLQHAAQMREAKVKPSRRIWFASLRRVAVTLVVVAVLFISGTNLVRAASATLPGDNLYPVKRTWEDMLVLFTLNLQQRNALEVEHENERLQELHELFAEGRSAEVEFAGVVTSQAGSQWIVAGVPVVISANTELRDGPILVGSAVRVKGETRGDGIVLAERVRLLPPDAKLPTAVEIESEEHESEPQQQKEDSSGKGSGEDEPKIEETKVPDSGRKDQSLEGTVTSFGTEFVIVNGIEMDVSTAEIKGTPSLGAPVKVEGYYDSNGVFIVTKIEYKDSGSGSDSGSNSSSDSSGDVKNDASGSGSDGSRGGSPDSTDDSGGGGGNSGSGGGGSGGGGGDD